MHGEKESPLKRIGVFYDGNYFHHVSNYYAYYHQRQCRISISGLHEFIRAQVASEEGVDTRYCQIVDAHYFRGRLSAQDANSKGDRLYWERVFDDVLMAEGIVTHYLPLRIGSAGRIEEKGIDVWLALEAFELAFYKHFDVLVLIASDGDYVPLVRKLNSLGTRVMVLAWDFQYTDNNGKERLTRTSQDLLEEVTYPTSMHEIIDNRVRKNEPIINNLFVTSVRAKAEEKVAPASTAANSEILSLKKGFGFIKYPPNNLFFHHTDVEDIDFNELKEGDRVEFQIGANEEGQPVAKSVRIIR